MIPIQVISICKSYENWNKVKRFIDKSAFNSNLNIIYTLISRTHEKHPEQLLTNNDLKVMHADLYPATPKSSYDNICKVIDTIPETNLNAELNIDIIKNFWIRSKAKEVGELAVDIFNGHEKPEAITGLKNMVERINEQELIDADSYFEIKADIDELFDGSVDKGEFNFRLESLQTRITALSRGHFCILLARPEMGKTTFSSFLASGYIQQKKKVTYWANEEPAVRIKTRIIQSHFEVSKQEVANRLDYFRPRYHAEIKDYLTVFDSVGTHIDEIDNYARLYNPDVMFIDQLDKVHINGSFNRTDEKLKEVYVRTREIAKRHNCLVWAVSQASYEAQNLHEVSYEHLDNSRTGKAGEADIILGIGRGEGDNARTLHTSKNKLNGWHGNIYSSIDIERGVFE
jgi:replicative DNA helicase